MSRECDGLLVDCSDGVSRITLNRPEKLNSLTAAMLEALHDEIASAAADEQVRVLLLTGAGRGFCAGQDLGERSASAIPGAPDLGASLERVYNPIIILLTGMAKPVVAAVNGVAAGAGCSLALACDIVVAAESAKFLLAFSKVGLVPDSGSTWLLPRLVGTARAAAMAMLAEPVDAAQAQQWGMIWKSVADENLAEVALEITGRLAKGPPVALGATKELFAQSAANSIGAQLCRERDAQQRAGRTRDYAEGVAAFLAKRPPVFRGN